MPYGKIVCEITKYELLTALLDQKKTLELRVKSREYPEVQLVTCLVTACSKGSYGRSRSGDIWEHFSFEGTVKGGPKEFLHPIFARTFRAKVRIGRLTPSDDQSSFGEIEIEL